MALHPESGAGLPDADSYLSVAEADAYHAAYGNAQWTGADVAGKESALRRATRAVDGIYGARFDGARATAVQALEWPRSGASYRGQDAIAADEVPKAVKYATAELALRELTTPGATSPDVMQGQLLSKTVTAGPVTTSKTFAQLGHGADGSRPRFPVVDGLLSALLGGGASSLMSRTVRG